jgi:hypothetical protein
VLKEQYKELIDWTKQQRVRTYIHKKLTSKTSIKSVTAQIFMETSILVLLWSWISIGGSRKKRRGKKRRREKRRRKNRIRRTKTKIRLILVRRIRKNLTRRSPQKVQKA